jgi:hypothetical protein
MAPACQRAHSARTIFPPPLLNGRLENNAGRAGEGDGSLIVFLGGEIAVQNWTDF